MTAPARSQRLLVCNCQRTMEIDGRRLAEALGLPQPLTVHSELCRSQIAAFEAGLGPGASVHVACTQEAPLFREVAAEKGGGEADLAFTNIRERAGWCAEKPAALPKMAALLAEAALRSKPTGVATLESAGVCLVYGRGQAALDVAAELSGRLSVTVLLSDPQDALPPGIVSVPIYKGRIRTATGHLGRFEVEVDGYAPMLPSSRGALQFVMARDGARSTCDVIFDMSGGTPLFADAQRRDGYLRADPGNPAAVARAMLRATDLVGEFEKPLYVGYDPGICAHARSQKVGCTNCLDNCPTGAIAPDGDHVAIDAAHLRRLRQLQRRVPDGGRQLRLSPARRPGGAPPRAARNLPQSRRPAARSAVPRREARLAPDCRHGPARQGPAAQRPAALAVLRAAARPRCARRRAGLRRRAPRRAGAARAPGRACRARKPGRPDCRVPRRPRLSRPAPAHRRRARPRRDRGAALRPAHAASHPVEAFAAIGSKRDIARTALAKLKAAAPAPKDIIALPPRSPYGRIHVDIAGCTLCLACVGACPTAALSDNPDRPQLSFTESACVQCGICVATCPEKVIKLEPRYNFSPAAMTPEVVKAEEPFHCVSCGKPFGTKSTMERVLARLSGKHAMFQTEAQLRLIQMCDTCRIVTVAESGEDPLGGGARPRVRTTDDYLRAETAAGKKGKTPEDFMN